MKLLTIAQEGFANKPFVWYKKVSMSALVRYHFENDPLFRMLRSLVGKRKKLLQKKTEQVQILKDRLFEIEQEYERRIGQIHRQEYIISLHIAQTRRIIDLLAIGLSYEEAISELQEIDEAKHGWEKQRFSFFDPSFTGTGMHQQAVEPTFLEDVKKLWKKLVRKFHPDLAETGDEKQKREKLMKKINNAYASGDLQTLSAIDEQALLAETETTAIADLEHQLEQIENAILRLENEFSDLKKGQWYDFLKAGKKKREKLFTQLEQEALAEVAEKEKELYKLQKKHNLG